MKCLTSRRVAIYVRSYMNNRAVPHVRLLLEKRKEALAEALWQAGQPRQVVVILWGGGTLLSRCTDPEPPKIDLGFAGEL